jgi:hypothetical protein
MVYNWEAIFWAPLENDYLLPTERAQASRNGKKPAPLEQILFLTTGY